MQVLLAIVIGLIAAASVYMFLARDLARMLLGFVLLGTAANLSILLAGRIGTMTPPLVAGGATTLADAAANPLPQALVLTAIVIGFGLTAFALVLVLKAYTAFGSLSSDDMTEAEGSDQIALPQAAPATPIREAA